MHNPDRQFSPDRQFARSFMLVLGMLTGVSVGQVALADSEKQSVPAARIEVVAEPLPTPAALTGQQVYNNVCIACHAPPGLGGAPALGNSEAWAPRIVHGMDTLTDHALNGYSGSTGIMPKKGGRVDLSDEEIIGAIEYMVGQVAQ